MIKTEFYKTLNGINLYRTYSDEGYFITRDGEMYEEAIDPEGSGRTYSETDEVIEGANISTEEMVSIILGGEID